MRKGLIAAVLAVAAIVAIVLISSAGNGDGGYKVRAIFDSGGFMVKGEEVRIAGANVGAIESVGITMPGETASYTADGRPEAISGKAVIVMKIDDPGFQDFRSDASCIIRPQSLIGEKFIDCRPTLPRAPGSPPAPPLKQVPDGEPGAGQYLLPLESNSTSVDPDLINDIQSLPYAQRFRLIFNDLGAGLAARGKDVEEIVKRANPVLRDVDRLFGILAAQRDRLAQLSADSEAILRPLSRERASVAGFFSNAGAAAEASAERGKDLQLAFRRFPEFLREFRLTMHSLQSFSAAAAPVFASLGKSAPSFTEATRLLAPFSDASTVALKSLGATGEVAGPKLRATDPIVRKSTQLARSGAGPTTQLAKFLTNTKQSGGWNGLVDLIYNTTATINGFDQFGHFTRGAVRLTNCLDYEPASAGQSSCNANFNGPNANAAASASSADLYQRLQDELARLGGGTFAAPGDAAQSSGATAQASNGGTAPLLDYLLGP